MELKSASIIITIRKKIRCYYRRRRRRVSVCARKLILFLKNVNVSTQVLSYDFHGTPICRHFSLASYFLLVIVIFSRRVV